MSTPDVLFEIAASPPAGGLARSVHGGAGGCLIEWGRAAGFDPPAAAGSSRRFRGRLAEVRGAWFEGSDERLSAYLLAMPGAPVRPEALDLLDECGWACAQRLYIAPGSALLLLHWMPEHLAPGAPAPGSARANIERRGALVEHGLEGLRRLPSTARERATSPPSRAIRITAVPAPPRG